jgi:hypothetical protein
MPRRLVIVRMGDKRTDLVAEHGAALWQTLADNEFVNRNRVACVGFVRDAADGSLIIVAPKAYTENAPSPAWFGRAELFQLIRVFRKARTELSTPIGESRSTQAIGRVDRINDSTLDYLDAAIFIRNDYKRLGLYTRRRPTRVRNSWGHPVNWRRTLDSGTLRLEQQCVQVAESIHTARRLDECDWLRRLQATAVTEISRLSGEPAAIERESILSPREWAAVKKAPNEPLRRARYGVFDDRGRRLCIALQAYLGIGSLAQKLRMHRERWFSYTAEFEYIWEAILRAVFCPHGAAKPLPAGIWHPFPEGNAGDGIKPSVEIRIEKPGLEAIVDAKDYRQDWRVLNGYALVGSQADYYKQVIYRLLLADTQRHASVNVLAFPGRVKDELFAVRGCHEWPTIEHSHVFEVVVDYDRAVRHWLRESRVDVASEVENLVESLRAVEMQLRKSAAGTSVTTNHA